jgi:ribosomal protein L32
VDHCPKCGKIYQRNLRNLCADCSANEDRDLRQLERVLLRNRRLSTEEAAEAANVPAEQIRSWIRSGKLKLGDYPNLTDQCDLCKSPIRSGHLCLHCSRRIKEDIARTLELERKFKERMAAANAYISKR